MIYAHPFRHAVVDEYLTASEIARVNDEWPDDGWFDEAGRFTIKSSHPELPTMARKIVDRIDIDSIEDMTGIKGLFLDPALFGAGLHRISPGGFLKMHVDFNAHPKGWHRRANVLIYVNREWRREWGGALQLGIDKPKRIDPMGGRCVIFETHEESWHGHPEPLRCPQGVTRRSIAAYLYTKDPPQGAAHTTIYKKC